MADNLSAAARARHRNNNIKYQRKVTEVIKTEWMDAGLNYEQQALDNLIKIIDRDNLLLPDIHKATGVPVSFLKSYVKGKMKRPYVAFVIALGEYAKRLLTEEQA